MARSRSRRWRGLTRSSLTLEPSCMAWSPRGYVEGKNLILERRSPLPICFPLPVLWEAAG